MNPVAPIPSARLALSGAVFRVALCLVALASAIGCATQPEPVQPYAYGVQTEDWFIEERAKECVASCDGLTGDARLLCVSECPGFVTANVLSCSEVEAWEDCAMAVRPLSPTEQEREAQARRQAKVSETIGLALLHVVRAGFASALENEDDDGEDEADRADRSEESPSERRRPMKRWNEKQRERRER